MSQTVSRPRSHTLIHHPIDNTVTLAVRDYPGDGPVILCLHGLTRSAADFDVLIPHLPEHCRLLVPDQRGRGRSSYDPKPEHYHLATYMADMWSLLEALAVDQVTIIGTSMGGLMGMLMHAANPARIVGLVLNDIGPELGVNGLQHIVDYVGKDMEAPNWAQAVVQTQAVQQSNYPHFNAQQWEAFARALYEPTGEQGAYRLAYDPAIADNFVATIKAAEPLDLWPVFQLLDGKPLLVIHGVLSSILTQPLCQKMQQAVASTKVVSIAERGHAPLLNEPEATAAIGHYLAELYCDN